MKKLTALLLLLLASALLVSCYTDCVAKPRESGRRSFTYLLVGMDDAAANTDVLALCSFSESTQRLVLVQIPRDTYVLHEGTPRKLNQIYPLSLASRSDRESLAYLRETVATLLGVRIDGYMAMTAEGLGAVIDGLGGIDLRLPPSLSHGEGKGETVHLDGAESVRFVRHRSSYATGDLGRVDAQKLFLSALLAKLRTELTLASATSLARTALRHTVSDVSTYDMIEHAVRLLSRRDSLSAVYMTLPGEAVYTGETWYYAVCRRAADDMTASYLLREGEFDPHGQMDAKDHVAMHLIYRDTHRTYPIYTEQDLEKIQIPSS